MGTPPHGFSGVPGPPFGRQRDRQNATHRHFSDPPVPGGKGGGILQAGAAVPARLTPPRLCGARLGLAEEWRLRAAHKPVSILLPTGRKCCPELQQTVKPAHAHAVLAALVITAEMTET
ncbi:hypothetical protein LDENG_00128300 [Lucifuga dentata]|nr:hypothetical protein LDENG_00128300 [Lucifuga dentata]